MTLFAITPYAPDCLREARAAVLVSLLAVPRCACSEAGGRELVRLPFQWPPKTAQALAAKGKEELGTVVLQLKP